MSKLMMIKNNVVHIEIQSKKSPMQIPLNEFACIYNEYVEYVGNPGYKTCEVEKCGYELRQSIVTPSKLKKFINLVCLWGLGSWLGGISEKNICSSANKPSPISALKRVVQHMNVQGNVIPSNTRQSITCIKNVADILLCPPLKHVRLSMASKFLRMLYPEYFVAYDEKHLQSKLLYSSDSKGYAEFCVDCIAIANKLNTMKCGKWRAAGVEAVIFHKLR